MPDTKLQTTIDKKLSDLLNGKGPEDKEKRAEDLQALALAIKWVSVRNKLDQQEWGKDLDDGTDAD